MGNFKLPSQGLVAAGRGDGGPGLSPELSPVVQLGGPFSRQISTLDTSYSTDTQLLVSG